MEEKPSLSSALFAGTRFEHKRFAGDIAWFRTGLLPFADPDTAAPGPEKKRKRKSKANAKKIKRKKKRADGAASAPGKSVIHVTSLPYMPVTTEVIYYYCCSFFRLNATS
ncbi:hypothetical protein ZWY2020_034390 [Hordeum vulgare]|nr:hypothetical protein ZWY2020_034390 [Hordeum vulgare]